MPSPPASVVRVSAAASAVIPRCSALGGASLDADKVVAVVVAVAAEAVAKGDVVMMAAVAVVAVAVVLVVAVEVWATAGSG